MKTTSNSNLVDGYFPKPPRPLFLNEPRVIYPSNVAIGRYVDILYDKWFKIILGAKGNKDILMDILQELIPERKIVDINYGRRKKRKVNPFIDGHDAYFDVECTDADGTRFAVEMQRDEQEHFGERALFYATFLIQEQVMAEKKEPGKKRRSHDEQYNYPPSYVISFLNFPRHENSDRILYRYDVTERTSGELLTNRIGWILVEMKNFRRAEIRKEDSFVEKISYAFTHMGTLDERPAALMEEVFEKLFAACEVRSLPEVKQQQYKKHMTTRMDRENILYTAEQRGERRGMKKGVKKATVTIANRLREKGVPEEIIRQATSLTPNDI